MRVTSTRGPHVLGQDSTPQGCASLSPSYRYHDHSAWETPDPVDARDAREASRALREEERHRGMEIDGAKDRGRRGQREVERKRGRETEVKAERWRERQGGKTQKTRQTEMEGGREKVMKSERETERRQVKER